jgi:RNA polymerase sigma-70 factor, ECF subfamily
LIVLQGGLAGNTAGAALADIGLADDRPDAAAVETALLLRVIQQDEVALRELYTAWYRPLSAVVMRILPHAADVDEVMQDAFVHFWNKGTTFDPGRGKAFSWAVMVTRGLALNHLRKIGRQSRAVELDWWKLMEQAPLDHRAEVERVALAMATLPEEERNCVGLAIFREMTHEEIAHELHTPLGTIKSRLRRALGKLRSLLQDTP